MRAPAPLHPVEHRVHRDAVDPGVEGRLVLERREPRVGLEEGLLREVLDLDRVLRVVPDQREDPRLVALHEELEGRLAPGQRLARFPIGQFCSHARSNSDRKDRICLRSRDGIANTWNPEYPFRNLRSRYSDHVFGTF